MNKKQIGVPFNCIDPTAELQGEAGTFIFNRRGESFLYEAKEGHSPVSGPTPIGLSSPMLPIGSFSSSPEPWTGVKIYEKPVGFREARLTTGGQRQISD